MSRYARKDSIAASDALKSNTKKLEKQPKQRKKHNNVEPQQSKSSWIKQLVKKVVGNVSLQVICQEEKSSCTTAKQCVTLQINNVVFKYEQEDVVMAVTLGVTN